MSALTAGQYVRVSATATEGTWLGYLRSLGDWSHGPATVIVIDPQQSGLARHGLHTVDARRLCQIDDLRSLVAQTTPAEPVASP